MTREEMIDEIINLYGFEHPYTILFADICETRSHISPNEDYVEQLFCTLIGNYEKYIFLS